MASYPLLTEIDNTSLYGNNSVCQCNVCERDFISERALYQHCSNASIHLGDWCVRCQRLFSSNAARDAHRRNSTRHNICRHCQHDFTTSEDCNSHLMEYYFQCLRCSRWEMHYDDLIEHMKEAHSYCPPCNRFFENQNNLRQVSVSRCTKQLKFFNDFSTSRCPLSNTVLNMTLVSLFFSSIEGHTLLLPMSATGANVSLVAFLQ
jgi:hypothetical protein